MMISQKQINQIVNSIKNGQVVIMPSDTIYGIFGSALNPKTVDKIYRLRKREVDKPFLILVPNIKTITGCFSIILNQREINFLNKIWPGPVSVVLDCPNPNFKYLHRGKNTVAFRIPNSKWLLEVLKKSGPIVAPSANFSGQKPSQSVEDAKNYFNNRVDLYIDGGKILDQKPSTVLEIKNNKLNILREGALKRDQLAEF